MMQERGRFSSRHLLLKDNGNWNLQFRERDVRDISHHQSRDVSQSHHMTSFDLRLFKTLLVSHDQAQLHIL